MKLEKAIQILSDSANSGSTTYDQDFKDAEKLGISALIREKFNRDNPSFVAVGLLPHETPE